ncbi:MAG: TlpA disulfide reductase family protein [Pseudomonadota bacterium]
MRDLLRLGLGALLYGVIALGANPSAADGLSAEQRAALMEMRAGDMRKLVIHKEARPAIDEVFRDQYGNEVTLTDYRGKVVVLNFWATWCPPCRAEMPSIDRLSGEMAGPDVEVLALSTDRFDVERVVAFFDEIDIQNLRVLQDRRGKVARKAGILGLPVTVILDREGREIARLQGDAHWDSADVKAIVTRIVEMTAPKA